MTIKSGGGVRTSTHARRRWYSRPKRFVQSSMTRCRCGVQEHSARFPARQDSMSYMHANRKKCCCCPRRTLSATPACLLADLCFDQIIFQASKSPRKRLVDLGPLKWRLRRELRRSVRYSRLTPSAAKMPTTTTASLQSNCRTARGPITQTQMC